MRIPAHWQAKLDAADALSGVDPDADVNMADFRRPDINGSADIALRLGGFTAPLWRNVAGVIRQGRKFGLEYPAPAPPEARASLLNSLRQALPYAIIADEGEGPTRFGRYGDDEEPQQVWRVGIVLGEPGWGISEAEVDLNREAWVDAAHDFRRVADGLLQDVLRAYEIGLDTLPHIGAMAIAPGGREHGHSIIGHELQAPSGAWSIQFHKGALFLSSAQSGQEVRVSMMHGAVGGVLHGFGLSRFVKTTPSWSGLAPLLRDDYFDARRVIERLHEAGCWERVPRNPDVLLTGTTALAAFL